MSQFAPYANEAEVLTIGQLTLENRLDRITVYGDLDLTADQQGLAYARQLQQVLNAIVSTLEAQQLPLAVKPVAATTVANPFGD
ncbi:MAG: hypothetical protein K2P77_05050 [Burkholderiaceae bacterium]|nr:hypothetical protein [Burkholderiaceae bacterium]